MSSRLFFLLALVAGGSAVFFPFYRPHSRVDSVRGNADIAAGISQDTVDARIDNFDSNNTATYKQRYWYNSNYRKGNGIVFLLIQGESIADPKWITNKNYTYLKLAASYGADVFMLEHRCFGYSRPYADLTFEHMSVCTMGQGLEDIHQFIQKMNTKMGYVKPRWVTFGGSYPGALSAVFRMKYPNDTVGAVASSAPMLWTLDFFQYAQVVNFVLQDTDPNCWQATNDAFTQMQQASLSNDGRKTLNTVFKLNPAFGDDQVTQLDVDNFFSNVFGVYQDTIQYTYDGRSSSTINGLGAQQLCGIMTNASEPNLMKRVANYNVMNGYDSGLSLDNSYSQMIVDLSNTTYDDSTDNAAARGWMWLCCNELGVLQTTDQGRNAFQQTIPLNYYVDMCTQMFSPAVNIKYIRDRNMNTLKKYGGVEGYKATNVVLPNGGYDPWHVLGVYAADPANHVTPILIPNAGHCSDMYPKYNKEPAYLDKARDIINREVAYFLGEKVVPIQYDYC